MAKRPRFSRWRRLPGVYRFGDKSKPQPKLEPQRLTLYLPWELLDAAEAQAAQAGVATIQEYCTLLLEQALDAERVRAQVANIEAQRGRFEGLHEIADDPEYLAEWSASQARLHSEPVQVDPPDALLPLPSAESTRVPDQAILPAPASSAVTGAQQDNEGERLSPAAEVVLRHAALACNAGTSFLANLRRGESVSVAEVAELARALHLLEAESRSQGVLDRRLVYALHRLAFEPQVLHTDAFPGQFDEWTVDTIRAVQEAVDRILSGEDIRYYSTGQPPEVPPVNWPDSPEGGTLGDGRYASFTDCPDSLDALRQAVVERVAQGLAIYPQGGCTALDYGGIPRAAGVALDLRALDRVIDYPAADMTITVQAGITLAALRAVLAGARQRLLVDAPQADRATLGGVYATATCGPRRFGAGRPRDQLIGVSFVNGDGAVVKGGGRVVKNVAGYDFPKLLTGSLGTLGIITQLTLKVRPLPEATALVWARWAQPDDLDTVLDRLNTSDTRPIAVELLNPSGAKSVGEPLGLPAEGWALAVGFEDNAAAVAWQVDRLRDELAPAEVVVRAGTDAEPLWSALTEFPAATVGPLSFTANLRPSSVARFVRDLDPALWAVQAHAGNGIVRGHALGPVERDVIAPALQLLRARAVGDGGNLLLPRCPTAWKSDLAVWGEPRADWALAERVKRALDPKGVMNPGRFVGTI